MKGILNETIFCFAIEIFNPLVLPEGRGGGVFPQPSMLAVDKNFQLLKNCSVVFQFLINEKFDAVSR